MSHQAPEKQIPTSINDYLEVMSKSVFQTGMSWQMINNKWPQIREAFNNFDIEWVSGLDEPDIELLMKDTRVVRNYRKLKAIAYNARKMKELVAKHGSFQNYLRAHGDFHATLAAVRKEFKFMGNTGTYAFLYVVGEEVIPYEEYQARYKA